MTMQTVHSPKPKVFGKGYGTHLSYNFKLVSMFFKLALQVFVNAFVPGLYYEQAHWKVIELYHKMRGYRHGINSDHRCAACGADTMSCDEVYDLRTAKKIIAELQSEIDNHRCDKRAHYELDTEVEDTDSDK